MNESEFNQRVDDMLMQIEDAVEASGADIDYESAGGILTLTFDNDSQIIINRQTPVKQIWMAARAGGFHFNFDENEQRWKMEGSGQDLFDALNQYCSEQAGEAVKLSDEPA